MAVYLIMLAIGVVLTVLAAVAWLQQSRNGLEVLWGVLWLLLVFYGAFRIVDPLWSSMTIALTVGWIVLNMTIAIGVARITRYLADRWYMLPPLPKP